MNTVIYWLGRAFIAFVQALPLRVVARLGRMAGGLAFHLTGRYRRVALQNLMLVFGKERSTEEIHSLAKENFRRIGENYACAVKTARMSFDDLRPHLEFFGFDKFPPNLPDTPHHNIIMAIGHFGNFELYARIQDIRRDYQGATTYRALKQPAMNRLLQRLRGQNGCLFFERRTEGEKLRELMNRGSALLGLLGDQSSRGVRIPLLGHDCNTGVSPAVFALRYNAQIFEVICYRTALAQWRIECGDAIPTHENGRPRTSEAIMRDVNQAYERAIRRDPANWFWVHRRWKN
jgi:KDO2-lipid IV(A) lauroyltransferase